MSKNTLGRLALLLALLVASAAQVRAQSSTGRISGTVVDSSGAVLPGVSVEATSPSLIEKVRTAVTDNEGRYNIANLVPGNYAVTFTLAAFKTVRREGVQLAAGFTAPTSELAAVPTLPATATTVLLGTYSWSM